MAGIDLDGPGNVFVVDQNNGRVQEFTSAGGYITTIGSPGSGDGQLTQPFGVAADASGNYYVADGQNARIERFFDVSLWNAGPQSFRNIGIGIGQALGSAFTVDSSKSLTVTGTADFDGGR